MPFSCFGRGAINAHVTRTNGSEDAARGDGQIGCKGGESVTSPASVREAQRCSAAAQALSSAHSPPLTLI